MDPRTINYLLSGRDHTQSSIARTLRVTPAAVSAVIAGKARSRKIENHISAKLALPLSDIWPQWYDEDGKRRNPRRPRINRAEAIAALQRQAA